jgi:hypothetical protein
MVDARPLVDASAAYGEAASRRPGGRCRWQAFAMPAAGGLPCALVRTDADVIADADVLARLPFLFLPFLPFRRT